ncbi:HAD family hydrolase [Mucilaginibacter sp. UR6-1]|uniref:HAD family hydrolase n=1 Tax=Mucilaginibacter sp. UR6-1 TaxID=1435643 RepID=UPI001E594E07|nr:HAD family hydrolase [Mucilaginibacter sp. UR6-1]MCC8409053.1 HAD family hydrolase [Mucilaginibacter sp. UR6-1]
MIRALIYDLDNTIYPVESIADDVFAGLFKLIDDLAEGISASDIQTAKNELTRRPFQKVADQFGFSDDLKEQAAELLRNITYNKPMQAYDDYRYVKTLAVEKFLVTTGFVKLQNSKVKMLGIAGDFKQIYVVDPDSTEKTKRHIFTQILEKFNYKAEEVLIVGDDPESEIKEAKAVGIKTVLYDPEKRYTDAEADYRITNHRDVGELIL